MTTETEPTIRVTLTPDEIALGSPAWGWREVYDRKTVEAIIQKRMAEAWDEGWEYGGAVGHRPKDHNPYA